MCSCNESPYLGQNDYSLQTANLGIANISSANPALTGASAATVFTASNAGGASGTIIKSIRIKATAPVTTGMVRLFVSNNAASAVSLYKEIPVPVTPVLDTVPMPFPLLPMFEMVLQGGLKLAPGFKLLAATQNAQSFNIVTEGLDWKYPSTLNACCNYIQYVADIGLGTISTANASLTGSGSIGNLYTVPASVNGATIQKVAIKALQPTAINSMVRIFVSPDGTNWTLIQEIVVPETNQSGFDPSWKAVVDLDLDLPTGYSIGASTQLAESFAVSVEALHWTYPIS